MALAIGHEGRGERFSFVSAKEAARILGVHPNTLCKWRISGKGPAFIKIGRRVRYRMTEISTWMSERTYLNTAQDQRSGRDRQGKEPA